MTIQLGLFAATSDQRRDLAAAPADPLHGFAVHLPDRCQCGSHDAVIGEGKGRIAHRCFVAVVKDIAAGWQTNRTRSLLKSSRKFGKPTAPIKIQRRQDK